MTADQKPERNLTDSDHPPTLDSLIGEASKLFQRKKSFLYKGRRFGFSVLDAAESTIQAFGERYNPYELLANVGEQTRLKPNEIGYDIEVQSHPNFRAVALDLATIILAQELHARFPEMTEEQERRLDRWDEKFT